MNPQEAFQLLACGLPVLVAYLAFSFLVFRLSCRLARVRTPSVPRTVALTLVVRAAAFAAEAALGWGVVQVYQAWGYPLWEAGVVVFFLALPLHMVICSIAHSRLARLRLGEALTVFLIEHSIKLGLSAVVAGLLVLAVVVLRANA